MDNMLDNKLKTTLLVSMVTYEGTLDLIDICKRGALGDSIISIDQSKMNRNKNILTSLTFKIRIKENENAVIHLYPARIKIIAKNNIGDVIALTNKILGLGSVKYIINEKRNDFVITFYSFGIYGSINDIEDDLINQIELSLPNNIKYSELFLTKAHVKGIKTEKIVLEVNRVIESTFNSPIYNSNLKMVNYFFCLANASYCLNKRIAIYNLAKLIKTVPGFEKSFSIYDNISNAHMITITLPLITKNTENNTLWRKDMEYTYTVRTTGIVTQSCPSIEYEHHAYEIFIKAIEFLGNDIIRNLQ